MLSKISFTFTQNCLNYVARLEEVNQDKIALSTQLEEKIAQLELRLDVQRDAYKVSVSLLIAYIALFF